MNPVEIPPLFVNIIVAIGICILIITVVYFALIKENKHLDLGEKEQVVLYGKEAKPIYGKY
jgi:hypothetical protein